MKKTEEIYYGKQLFNIVKNYMPDDILTGGRRLKNGIIEIKVWKKFGKKVVGINPLIQIGESSLIKKTDTEDLCNEAVKKINDMISKLDDKNS